MDLEELETSKKPTSRVPKFAPKSSKLKPKPKPKSEPPPKPESQPPTEAPVLKPEPQEFDLTANKKEDADETVAPPKTLPKPELAGAGKIDVEPKSEMEDESRRDDPMVVDKEPEEDAVVREIEVFFAPSIDVDTKLYALQFPLRPSWRPYELDERCEEVRLKPESSEVEVDLSIDLESNNIDKEFASKINYTKETLSTSCAPPLAKNGYAVGLLMGDKLHLHPVHSVVQLRPSSQHRYSGSSKRKNVASTGANATVKVEASIEEKSVATSKKQNKQMESPIGQNGDGEERWVPLKYHSCKSDISCRYLQQMVGSERSPIKFTMNACDYVTTLCPGVSSNIVPRGPSKRELDSLPVEERLKKWLTEGPPLHRFSAIKHYASEYSDEQLLRFLQEHAILIQGLWTPKTSVLYPQGGVETVARDYTLVLFSKNLKVESSDVNVGSKLGNHVKQFLKIFGLERSDPRKSSAQLIPYWNFREDPDVSFKKLYPKIVKEQEELLKKMEQNVSQFTTNVKGKLGKDVVASRSMKTELVKSANSDQRETSVGGMPRHSLLTSLKKLLQTHKVCSFQTICHGLREMAVSNTVLSKVDTKIVVDAAQSLDVPQDELKAVISEVAREVCGNYVLKSPANEPFREVVIDLLRGSGADAKLKKAEIFEAAKKKLNRDPTSSEYTKVMTELCVSKGSHWVLKSGDRNKQ